MTTVGRDFQDVTVAVLTVSAGFVAENTILKLFGLMIFSGFVLREQTIWFQEHYALTQFAAHTFFVIGYLGGGANFILTFFREEYHFYAFIGLGILALSYMVMELVDFFSKQERADHDGTKTLHD